MILETGKEYITRSGKIIKITNRIESPNYPFFSNDNQAYTSNGNYWSNGTESEYDIMEEYIENSKSRKINEHKVSMFEYNVTAVLNSLKELLIKKNTKYGNSALEPVRVFSDASSVEQIKVRLDDKLSRLKTQSIEEDEDVLQDLMGYLVLLSIAIKK